MRKRYWFAGALLAWASSSGFAQTVVSRYEVSPELPVYRLVQYPDVSLAFRLGEGAVVPLVGFTFVPLMFYNEQTLTAGMAWGLPARGVELEAWLGGGLASGVVLEPGGYDWFRLAITTAWKAEAGIALRWAFWIRNHKADFSVGLRATEYLQSVYRRQGLYLSIPVGFGYYLD